MPRPRARLSKKDVSEIRALYIAGERRNSIASKYGCTESAVSYHVRDIEREPLPSPRMIDDAIIQRAQEMRDEGTGVKRIAYILGVSQSVISNRTKAKERNGMGPLEHLHVMMPDHYLERLNAASCQPPYKNRSVIVREAVDAHLRQMGF